MNIIGMQELIAEAMRDAKDDLVAVYGRDAGMFDLQSAYAKAVLSTLEKHGMRIVPFDPTERQKIAGIDAAPTTLLERQPGGRRRREGWTGDECAKVYQDMISALEAEQGEPND